MRILMIAVKVMEGNQRARVTVILTYTRAGDLMSTCIVECSKNAGSTRYVQSIFSHWI
jgi:hypothetical protein